MRIHGIRCFNETGEFRFGAKCNIIVGKNNTGKSTIIKSLLGLQGFPFDLEDIRPGHESSSYSTITFEDVPLGQFPQAARNSADTVVKIVNVNQGEYPNYSEPHWVVARSKQVFPATRPNHMFVPFVARRKAAGYDESVSEGTQAKVTGTLSNLYSRIDLLSNYGHSGFELFVRAVKEIVGLKITTRASTNGKVAGYYFHDNKFIPIDRMGDGVSEMVALIVGLCVETNKIFVIEEPETNLHPSGLKALLAMIRRASEKNQFVIATHSNIVVRELGGLEECKVLRVFREDDVDNSPSKVEEVENSPTSHLELLRELGYEFADFNLYAGWLFLEEASAERIIREVLVPLFVPDLRGLLRTFSSAGASSLEPSVAEFRRLVVFVHLQELYKGRIWVRADGDDAGKKAVAEIQAAFPDMGADTLSTFAEPDFEKYYPSEFAEKVGKVLAVTEKKLGKNVNLN